MIQTAGYIVTNNEAIWGAAATADAAWQDFLNGMNMANVRVVTEPTEDDLDDGINWARECDYSIKPATGALLAEVETRGGQINWHTVGGVCCTQDEQDAYEAE